LVLNAYGNGCLRAVTGIKRIENRVSLVLNDYGHGCLRAVIGIKIRDVRGLGDTQLVWGGGGLGVRIWPGGRVRCNRTLDLPLGHYPSKG
jgi:hypothetical protein